MHQQPGVQTALIPGQTVRVNRHEVSVERYLSQGGYALVYIVTTREPINNATRHVLKRIITQDEAGLKDVQNEVQVMRRLQGHPNIVHLIDSSWRQLPDRTFEVLILMELCVGGGIIDMMNRRLRERLTEAEILQVFVDICEAVAFMHSRKPPILHRDLKVENILQSSPTTYKLCDFGSASGVIAAPHSPLDLKNLEFDLNKHTTLQYRAPEMVDLYLRRRIDEKSDIWALGVLLYKLCYYTTPFEEHGPIAILTVQFKFPAYPVYSHGLLRLIARMLQEHGVQRPSIASLLQSVHELRGTRSSMDYAIDTIPSYSMLSTTDHRNEAHANEKQVVEKQALTRSPGPIPARTSSTSTQPLSNTLANVSSLASSSQISSPSKTGYLQKSTLGKHQVGSVINVPNSTSLVKPELSATLVDSFGEAFGATRPTTMMSNSQTLIQVSKPVEPTLLSNRLIPKTGKTGNNFADAFEGLDELSIRGLSLTGPSRINNGDRFHEPNPAKLPSPIDPRHHLNPQRYVDHSSPLPSSEALPAEIRYPSIDDIETTVRPGCLLSLAQSNSGPSSTRPDTIGSKVERTPYRQTSRSQHTTGTVMKPNSMSTGDALKDGMNYKRSTSGSGHLIVPSQITVSRPASTVSGDIATGRLTEISLIETDSRSPRTKSPHRIQSIDVSILKSPLEIARKPAESENPIDYSSNDDSGPENPVNQFRSNSKISNPTKVRRRGRQSSVHNLVDFYESGIRKKGRIDPVDIEIQVTRSSNDISKTLQSPGSPARTKPKRPNSMFVTPSTSFNVGSCNRLEIPDLTLEKVQPTSPKTVLQDPDGSKDVGNYETVQNGPSTGTSAQSHISNVSRIKSSKPRTLSSLLESDYNKHPKSMPVRVDSPERPFGGVGELIQRWQALSQNK